MASEYVKTSGHFNRTIVYFIPLIAWPMQKVKMKLFTFRERLIDQFLDMDSPSLQLKVHKRASTFFLRVEEVFPLHVLPFFIQFHCGYFAFSCFNMYILVSNSKTLIPDKFLCQNLNLFSINKFKRFCFTSLLSEVISITVSSPGRY